jgi:hypothetical protein
MGREVRDRARAALVALGHPPDERAERLAPEEFRELARLLDSGGALPHIESPDRCP